MITDMTEGSPSEILWKFSMPMLLSSMFQQLYSIVDSIVAGKFIGEDALAAVGASYPITMIFMAIATGCNIGCSVVISHFFGAKELEKMKTSISTSIISVVVISIILTVSGLLACKPIMRLLNTPENIFNDAALFLNVYIGGLIFLFLYNICTGIFTALGDSRTPLNFLIISSIGNIILDFVFVVGFHMGVDGVAWATFIAQGISSILASVSLFKRLSDIHTDNYKLFSWNMFSKISKIAVPSILQQSFVSVGNLFIQGIVNGYGSAVIAGYSGAIKLNTFAVTSFTTISNGLSSFSAQNLGAKKTERVKQGFKSGTIMVVCIVLIFVFVYCTFSKQMIELFISNPTQQAIDVGRNFLLIVSPFYITVAMKVMCDGVLRGAGAMTLFMITTFLDLILRVILAFILSANFGVSGIWASWPIGWTISSIVSCVFYFSGLWNKEKTKI